MTRMLKKSTVLAKKFKIMILQVVLQNTESVNEVM